MGRKIAGIALASFLLALGNALGARAECDLPQDALASPNMANRFPVTARDIARLRDIGYQERPPQDSLFSPSPDGKSVAFILTQADPEANSYCNTLMRLDLVPGSVPKVLNKGGDRIFEIVNIRGLRTGYGYPAQVTPSWSPDGKIIAYLRRSAKSAKLWVVGKDGTDARPLTPEGENVELFAWNMDGRSLVYAIRPDLDNDLAVQAEGLRGYAYDDRMVPAAGPVPSTRLPVDYQYKTISLEGERPRSATEGESEKLRSPKATDAVDFALVSATAVDGVQVWTAQDRPVNLLSAVHLYAKGNNGRVVKCSLPACSGDIVKQQIFSLFWDRGAKRVLFLRREGRGGNATALYAWRIGSLQVERLFNTPDLLASCHLVGERLLCLQEASTRPRRLVSIDLRSGRSKSLYDPNPEFPTKALGKVERIFWQNRYGLDVYGDLVLPPSYGDSGKLPLIIVQYRSRGFLRGGTGDEYPIFALAAQGFAILSIDAPPPIYTKAKGASIVSWKDAEVANTRGWAERWSKLSAVEEGVDLLVKHGLVDPHRIGITGLSDGSTTVQFALVNRPDLFAAAAVSTCCVDEDLMMIYGGPALAADRIEKGYPPISSASTAFWKPASLRLNARAMKTPLLMQLADHEYIGGIASFTALREQNGPAALYVFPNEYHLKAEPAHRLAIYERNIDWFRYWLQDVKDPDPGKAGQYMKWDQLKSEELGK